MNIGGITVSLYGVLIVCIVLFKLGSSRFYTPVETPAQRTDVAVIVPVYNEDPELLRQCFDSLLGQTYRLSGVYVTDDGSDDAQCWEVMREYADTYSLFDIERLSQNMGKRQAQRAGITRATDETIFVTVDSDSILEPDAIEEIVKPFADEDVTAVTGSPQLLNADESRFMSLVNMRYWVASNIERASQSVFGTVYCCCGVFSAYRADVVREHLDEYTSQRFRGVECTYGDDRHLTSYMLRHGEVIYQSTAVVWTESPSEMRAFLRQQTRWMRSFWRESYLTLRWAPWQRPKLAAFVGTDVILPFALLFFGVGNAILTSLGNPVDVAYYLGVISLMALLRNIPYVTENARTYLASPAYGLFYFCLLLPLSFYALGTLSATSWGTR